MKNWPAVAAVACLALLSFFVFPGHTWLQQDTQIYLPILEHLRDPNVLAKDILVERPHVSYTLYDESARALRALTGLEFRDVLAIQQILTRALGIWGIYLMATAAGLGMAPALLVAAVLSLGGFIVGPEVVIFEYEPIPRGFAVPLLLLGTGLAAHRRYLGASVAGAVAFLIHPPTVYPFWAVYGLLILRRKRWIAFLPMLAAVLIIWIASRFQPGQTEAQSFFTREDPAMETMQRMRTAYVWISTWWKALLPQYLLLYAVTLAGWARLRRQMSPEWRLPNSAGPLTDVRGSETPHCRQSAYRATTVRESSELSFFHIGLPLVGMLSMPLSWLLLERMKWALMPQFQPMRALLFVTLFAIFSAAVAACAAAAKNQWPEAFAWFILAYLVPLAPRLLQLPDARRAAVVVLLAAMACASIRLGRAAIATTALAAFFLIPGVAKVVNYPNLHTAPLAQLAAWARQNTPADAIFLFPDAGKDLSPGIFRAESLRAVYVDWKGGGQVNYLKELGEQWWSRWQNTMAHPLSPEEYRKLGIDYLVVRPEHRLPGRTAAFVNERYAVYRLTDRAMSLQILPQILRPEAVRQSRLPLDSSRAHQF